MFTDNISFMSVNQAGKIIVAGNIHLDFRSFDIKPLVFFRRTFDLSFISLTHPKWNQSSSYGKRPEVVNKSLLVWKKFYTFMKKFLYFYEKIFLILNWTNLLFAPNYLILFFNHKL